MPVARRARELGLPLLQPARLRSPEAVAAIAALEPDLGVLADYGQIVPAARARSSRRTGSSTSIRRCCRAIAARRRSRRRSWPATRSPASRSSGWTRASTPARSSPASRWPLDGTETAPDARGGGRAAWRRARSSRDRRRRGSRGRLPAAAAGRPTGVTPDPPAPARGRPARPDAAGGRARAPGPRLPAVARAPSSRPADGRLIVHAAAGRAPGCRATMPGTLVADGDGLALTTADGRLRLIEVQLAGRRRTDAASLRRGAPGAGRAAGRAALASSRP